MRQYHARQKYYIQNDINLATFQRQTAFQVCTSNSLSFFDQCVYDQALGITFTTATIRQSMGRNGLAVEQYRTSKQLRRRRVTVGMSQKEVSKRLARMRRSKNMARGRRRLTRISLSQRLKNVDLVKVINGNLSTDRAEWREDATRWGREKYGSTSNSLEIQQARLDTLEAIARWEKLDGRDRMFHPFHVFCRQLPG